MLNQISVARCLDLSDFKYLGDRFTKAVVHVVHVRILTIAEHLIGTLFVTEVKNRIMSIRIILNYYLNPFSNIPSA